MNRFLFSLISNATDFIHRQTDVYINQHLNTSGWAVLVMEATIGSCDATPTGATLERLMNVLLPLTVDHSKAEVRLSACRLVAALINKLPEGKQKIGISFLFLFPITFVSPLCVVLNSCSRQEKNWNCGLTH